MRQPIPKRQHPEELPKTKCGHYGHRTKTGALCHGDAVKGTTACRMHAGKKLEQHRAEGQLRIEFSKWTLDGHDGANLDPRIEILRLISFWKWKSNLYGTLLREAYEAAEQLRKAHQAKKILLADEETETRFNDAGDFAGILHEDPALQTARADLERIFTTGGVTAFVGDKYDVDRDGRIFATDEGIRALVQLEQKAHEMVGKFCSLAVQAKVAETRIALAEQVGVMIQAVILGVLRDLGVSATDRRVQDLVVTHIDQATAGPLLLTA
ncbi:hypothetical protein [Actinoplanes sp. NBRC 101535]|uniref:hypothetical protein n=1 Tax=Actinoplanes sp. NBRC 101535 TaxID=3032196 RepID=UPI00249FBF2A|nr:hypothetical protein [Actinoplanes sp. NBRC 101535]GLY08236.1 hypothetical protein Acsp01_86150 [Actinoplanes sp. NBRC 101535]